MVKNPPASAGDMGLILDLGGSHMPRSKTKPVCHNYSVCGSRAQELLLLSPHAATTEDRSLCTLEPVLRKEKPRQQKPMQRKERAAPACHT